MSVIATALKHLLAAGVSGDDLVRAVEELETEIAASPKSVDAAAARRREADRLYQASKRAERRQNRPTSADSPDAADAAPNDIYSNPKIPPVEASASTAPRGRSDRGSKIPEDWKPPAIADLSPEARALAERWPAAAYRAEAEAFRNYWLAETGKGSRKSDWDRAWANRIVAVNGRVMREAKATGQSNGVGQSSGRPMNAQQIRSAIAYAEDNGNPDRVAELKQQLASLVPAQGPAAGMIADTARKPSAGARA